MLVKPAFIKPIVVATALVALVSTLGVIVAGRVMARSVSNQAAASWNDQLPPRKADVPAPTQLAAQTSAGAGCASTTGWDCQQQTRFAAAASYLAKQNAKLGAIIHDRTTGAIWQAGSVDYANWTASTIKLGISAVLLEWNRSGNITLSGDDRTNMRYALVDSNNDAATALWDKYGGQELFDRLRGTYLMTNLSVVPGYELFWRNLRCNTEDLHQMMLYILDKLNSEDRSYLTTQLRGVGSNQQWGVWAAGSGQQPGNKNGWVQKPDPTGSNRWVTHTVGFAGPGERYIVAVTCTVPASGGMSDGIHVVSDLVATIFGSPVPATVKLP
jgi:hypothetical protein